MSVLLESLQQISFKGAEFLFSSQSQQGGRKSVVFEYPDQDQRVVQDLGKMLNIYNIVGVIYDNGFDYYSKRTALLNALNSEGSGTLVHPFEGDVEVFCTNYTFDEQLGALNVITFNMTFYEVGTVTFPTTSSSYGTNIEGKFDNFINSISNDFSNFWGTTFGYLNNFNYSKDLLQNLINTFDNIPSQLSSVGSGYFDFAKSVTDFNININSSVGDSSLLTNLTNTLFDSAGNLSDETTDQYTVASAFFNYNAGDQIDVTTSGLDERELNRRILLQYINSQALIYAYTFTTQQTFSTNEEVKARSDALNDQFATIILNNNYTDISGRSQNLLSDETVSELETLRSEAHGYLRDQDTSSQNIITVNIPRNSLIPLTYAYYGDLDLKDTLYNLNNLKSAINISGDFKIIESDSDGDNISN